MLFSGVVDQNVHFPNSFTVCSTAFRQNSSWPTSPPINKHLRPSFSTSRLVSFASLCSSRYHDRNLRTLFRKGNCDCAANPAVTASAERHFPSQFSTTAIFFVLGSRPRLHFVFAARSSVLMLRRLNFPFFGHKRISRAMDFARSP